MNRYWCYLMTFCSAPGFIKFSIVSILWISSFPSWALKWAFDCLPQIKMLKIHCSGLCFFQLCTVGLGCIDIHSMLILILGIQCNCQQAVRKIKNNIHDMFNTLNHGYASINVLISSKNSLRVINTKSTCAF